jgi:hypothetical protein
VRGSDALQESLFTVAKLDDFVPADHPLRAIRLLVNEASRPRRTRPQYRFATASRRPRSDSAHRIFRVSAKPPVADLRTIGKLLPRRTPGMLPRGQSKTNVAFR